MIDEIVRSDQGSSPRGRGKRGVEVDEAGRFGLIPARAGKTTSGRMTRASRRAHPRAGGENRLGAGWRRGGSGRIPARAGKTRDRTRRGTNRRAHPRAGGENQLSHVDLEGIVGSSPRGRGKHQSTVEQPVQGRIIPARAGKTSSPRPRISAEPAHPRAGGENLTGLAATPLTLGSSPRGRGKRGRFERPSGLSRLIPARAGKTLFQAGYSPLFRAHPRAGGENAALVQ